MVDNLDTLGPPEELLIHEGGKRRGADVVQENLVGPCGRSGKEDGQNENAEEKEMSLN
jgi:hypothetical protein